jgi:hypothetical protein
MKLSHILRRFEWTITNFASKIHLHVEGLDPCYKNLNSFPTSKDLAFVFGKR